jgi:hypothetical protein
MSVNVQQVYQSHITPLSIVERLELARLIMSDLMKTAPHWALQVDDIWSDEDLEDISVASRHYAMMQMENESD